MQVSWSQFLFLAALTTALNLTAHAITGCMRTSALSECSNNNPVVGEVCRSSARIEAKLDMLLEVKREQLEVLREIVRLTREGASR